MSKYKLNKGSLKVLVFVDDEKDISYDAKSLFTCIALLKAIDYFIEQIRFDNTMKLSGMAKDSFSERFFKISRKVFLTASFSERL